MLRKLTLLFLCIAFTHVYAQDKQKIDTIELANNLASAKKYSQAISLLKRMAAKNPKNIEPLRLHGQILYWMKDFDKASLFYKKASVAHPALKLDHGKLMLNLYRLNEARIIYADYLKKDSKNIEALSNLGVISYNLGRTPVAKKYFEEVLKVDRSNEEAKNYLLKIAEETKPSTALNNAHSQDNNKIDTIELANKLASEKKYSQAISLLKRMAAKNPKNIEPLRLHGQILYWMKDFDAALLFYQKASVAHPTLKLDHGKLLLDLYRLNEAKEVYKDYLKKDSKNIEALSNLGLISYNQGRTQAAKSYFEEIRKIEESNEQAKNYISKIAEDTKPSLNIYGSYLDDSQPLSSILSGADFQWYRSHLVAPKLSVQTQYFNPDSAGSLGYTLYLGNHMYSSDLRMKYFLGGGVYVSPVDKKANLTWDIFLSKKIVDNFSLDVSIARKGYFNTLASLQQNVAYHHYGASFLYNKADGWMWQIGYIAQQFNDDNTVQNVNAYVISQPIKLGDVNLYLGYAFSYGSTATDHLTATSTVLDAFLTDNYNPLYIPYYTPKNELENYALANLSYKPSKAFKITLDSKIGFYATADRGYFFLENNDANETIIAKDYSSQKFSPYQINGKISYTPSSNFTLNVGYNYTNTFFYHIKTATLGLNLRW